MLFPIVANFDFELKQLDVKKTFIQGDLEEEILMKQLDRIEVPEKE